jgi:hypothetical protein
MRLLVLVLVFMLGAAAAQAGLAEDGRLVPCSEGIGETAFPYIGSSRPAYRYRTLLDAVSVPPAFLPKSSLTIAGCGDTPSRGHAFAGGFFVRRASCVPLTFSRGGRSATAWFGVGRRCT